MRSWLTLLNILVLVMLMTGCTGEKTPPPEPEIAVTSAPAPTTPANITTLEATVTKTRPVARPNNTSSQPPFREINFTGVSTLTNKPSQVQVVFSLRDQEGHAIVLPAEEIGQAARVYERPEGEQGWEEIDYTETSFFVHTAENFRLEVVFVLDLTNSMAQASLPDGTSGIDAMIGAFESAVLSFPGAHRIGVVEFHDRNVDPTVLSPMTTDRASVLSNVRRFAQSGLDHGSSRVWDSLVAASDLFSGDASVVKALVFLSDGRDTSSVSTREQAAQYAAERGVQMYALGVGGIYQESGLRTAALQTCGSYYRAKQVAGLEDQLKTIVSDLRGQYKISYITLRRTGTYETRISVNLRGVRGTFDTAAFDVTRFLGPDNRGVAQSDPASVDRVSGEATLFMRALHVPRSIDRIRFMLETSKPVVVELVPGQDGGLLQGWGLSGPDEDGFYEASSSEPIEFGNFGPLFKVTVSNVTEDRLSIPVTFDDSIYTGGKGFSHPLPIAIGQQTVRMYWADIITRKIMRANPDGSEVRHLVTGLEQPEGIALDPSAGKLYWTNLGTGKIQRANLDGSEVEDVITGLDRLSSIALDPTGGKMYWGTRGTSVEVGLGSWSVEAPSGDGNIQRANLDGSHAEDLVTGVKGLGPIALYLSAGKMYWASLRADKIQRANLDGSQVQDLVTGVEGLGPIALDPSAGKLYWTALGAGKIQRANLDGSQVQDIVTGLESPSAIALDLAAGGLYWADGGTGKIQRANLDGLGVQDLITATEWEWPRAMILEATVRAIPTATPQSTYTPCSTNTPIPTATPTPTPTAAPTPTPTPTPKPTPRRKN